MPAITPIKTIIDSKEDGDRVLAIKGTLIGIYDAKRGTSREGKDYCVQNIEVSDGTGRIKCSLWDQPEIPKSAKGKTVAIESREGKDGWIGCSVKVESWTDKKTNQPRSAKVVSVTQWGMVILDGGQAGQPAPTQGQLPHDTPRGSVAGSDLKSAKQFIARTTNLYVVCRRAADAVLRKEVTDGPGDAVNPENIDSAIASATSCVFIECCKAGLQSAMPLDIHKPQENPAPTPPPPPPPPLPPPEPEQAADPAQNPSDDDVPF